MESKEMLLESKVGDLKVKELIDLITDSKAARVDSYCYSAIEAAKYKGVKRITIYQWLNHTKNPIKNYGKHGAIMISKADLDAHPVPKRRKAINDKP